MHIPIMAGKYGAVVVNPETPTSELEKALDDVKNATGRSPLISIQELEERRNKIRAGTPMHWLSNKS